MNEFLVNGCKDCPFQNTDTAYCNVADEDIYVWSHEAQEVAPENCPLRVGPVVVSLINGDKHGKNQ